MGLGNKTFMFSEWTTKMGNAEIFDKKKLTFPDAFSNAATISKTDVPLPVPKLYTSQPVDTCTNKFYIQPCLNNI